MENRKDVTSDMSYRLERHLKFSSDPRVYSSKEVTFDYATDHSVRVDYMMFKPLNNTVSGIEKGDFYCYEVKSSVEDFHNKNGHNFIGDFNYYVMPRQVYEKIQGEIPYFVGVYVEDELLPFGIVSVRKSRRKDRTRPASEMLLMMYRSTQRDALKYRKEMQK